MNKLLLIFSIISFFFISCGSKKSNDFQEIKAPVEAVERIVHQYDNNVQSAIDSKNFNYIRSVSKSAIDSAQLKLEELKTADIDSEYEDLRQAAISYITAMQGVITAEQNYTKLNDRLSKADAKEMDSVLIRSLIHAKKEYALYMSILEKSSAK